MLEYNDSSNNSKTLAVHYAEKVGGEYLIVFMKCERDVASE